MNDLLVEHAGTIIKVAAGVGIVVVIAAVVKFYLNNPSRFMSDISKLFRR